MDKTQKDTLLLAKRAMQIHRGAARAAVLGVNDGLVSTLCIVLAVAAAQESHTAVLIAGFAGLIAGAVSMAAGEWISVKSQVELFKGVLDDLHKLVHDDEELLVNQLKDNFEETGLTKATAKAVAAETASKNHEHFIKGYARNVMGINPDELGSPWVAAISSFALFTAGALVPLSPWFFIEGNLAIGLSIGLTAVAGLVVGGYVSRSSGNKIVRGAARQVFIIALASVVTYGIGHLFGSVVG